MRDWMLSSLVLIQKRRRTPLRPSNCYRSALRVHDTKVEQRLLGSRAIFRSLLTLVECIDNSG
jgi:hypothetical protein